MSNPLIQILDRTGKNKNVPLEPEVAAPLDLAAVRAKLAQQNGRTYWRSLEELAGDEEFNRFLEREFPRQAPRDMAPIARRDFLKLMGASLALAGVSGCAFQPSEQIVGYVKEPEDLIPGVPQFYATAMTMGGYAIGLLAESNMGRPTKIEGNPSHPSSLGATDIFAQASILGLYDPSRSKSLRKLRDNATWEDFTGAVQELAAQLQGTNGAGFHLLTENITSPTLGNQIAQLKAAFPQMQWHQYEPNTRDGARAGAQQAFGAPTHLVYHFDRADRVLSLDANFLMDEPGSVRYARDFTDRRRARQGTASINRMYMVESTPTITGAMADHRLPVSASMVQTIAQALAAKIGAPGVSAPTLNTAQQKWVDACAADLQAARGRVVVVAGGHQSAEVHVLAHAINSALGALNTTVTGHEPVELAPPPVNGNTFQQAQSLQALVSEIQAGRAKVLLMLGGNPAFSAPADLRFGEMLEKAVLRQRNPLVAIHLSPDDNETSVRSTWHIPETHYLESWGDARGHDGTISIVQPLIQPMYPQARSAYEVLATFLVPTAQGVSAQPNTIQPQYNPDRSSLEIVQGYWQIARGGSGSGSLVTGQNSAGGQRPGSGQDRTTGATSGTAPGAGTMGLEVAVGDSAEAITAFQKQWQTWLHDGIVPNSASPQRTLTFTGNVGALAAPKTGGMEVMFRPDPTIWDGRFVNNAWLQELPKPLIKTTWDNTVLLPFSMAEKLGVTDDDLVNVKVGKTFVQLPVTIAPGHPENSVTVHYGYGRTRAGAVGNGTGRDVMALRNAVNMNWAPVEVTKAGGRYRVARTAHHNIIDPRDKNNPDDDTIDGLHERALIQSATIEQFARNPRSVVGEKPTTALPVVGLIQQNKVNTGLEHEAGGHAGEEAGEKHGEEKAPGFPSLYPDGRDAVLNDINIQYAWGMSIDTSTCIGCNACVIACQAENNSAVTGKDQVMMGREMHWLRIDTYYHGDVDDPQVYFQPVMCMHCEKAPCEPVCPVVATQHSPEGINEMVYNRCIGTRYCSNNCPYKVRRFNYLQYSEQNTPQIELMANPDVTVRARGVMEKCTYCIQRVQEAKIQAKKEDRMVRDGEIVMACQQACPTNTIIFGDIRNEKSQVSQLKKQPHTYGMLTELNTYPRTTYLAKIHNPNPTLKEAVESDSEYLHPADFAHEDAGAEHGVPAHADPAH